MMAPYKERGLAWAVLAVLVVQNSALALVMRYSRASTTPKDRYISSTAVFMTELWKLVVSLAAVFHVRSNCTCVHMQTEHIAETVAAASLMLLLSGKQA
jgi:hypothetical protein